MRLYAKFFKIHLKQQMQYKLSFFLSAIGQVGVTLASFFSVYFMFLRFNSVAGFTFSQVLLCFSVVLIAFSLAECFWRGFDTFPQMLGNGEFDRALVRPKNEIFSVMCHTIDFTRLSRLLQAVVMLIYAIGKSGVIWQADKIITLILMIIFGFICFCSLFLLYAGISFFTVQGLEFMNIFTDGAREFGQYPFAIYGKGVLKFLTYVVPLALFQYYPFLYLLGKETSKLYMLCPAFCLPFAGFCCLFWRFALRHYKSTGS